MYIYIYIAAIAIAIAIANVIAIAIDMYLSTYQVFLWTVLCVSLLSCCCDVLDVWGVCF